MPRTCYVYILTNRSGTLYTGVTSNLLRRLMQHRAGTSGFTSRYRLNRLVWFESTPNVLAAITREKQIKGWSRSKKLALISQLNPSWKDLSEGWFEIR